MTGTGDVQDYAQLPLGRFLDMVASHEPAPGGGVSAAVAVALAAALAGMAARLSADHLADAFGFVERADALRKKVTPLAQADAKAYGRVLAAYRLPRDTDPQVRRRRIEEALSEAVDVPLAIAEVGAEVARLATRLARDGNRNLRGDALAASLLAEAGVRAAANLAEINLSSGGVEDDRRERVGDLLEAISGARSEAPEGVG